MAKSTFSYEKSYEELQTIIESISDGTIGIDKLQEKVKRARVLIKSCQDKLRATEKEIEKMIS